MNPWLQARNLLVVRMDNIGDILNLTPALRSLKENLPDARITLLASPAGATAAPIVPWIDDVIVWRAVWQDVGGHVPFDPTRERALIDELAARRFDAAFIFTSFSQTPHVPGYVCGLAGIPLRAGESKEFGGGTLTTELKGAPALEPANAGGLESANAGGLEPAFAGDRVHQVDRNLRLIEQLGFTVRDRRMEIAIPAEAWKAAPALLQRAGIDPHGPYVLLHPGASAQARRYPAERFGEVAALLGQREWPVLVTGVEREEKMVAAVLSAAPEAGALIGGTSLAEYAALIERAALVICNDTLPMHLADAVGTPAVVLFSGTDYEDQWRPRFVPNRLLRKPTPCHPCYLFECPIGQPCLAIPPAEVVSAAEELLAAWSERTPVAWNPRSPAKPAVPVGGVA